MLFQLSTQASKSDPKGFITELESDGPQSCEKEATEHDLLMEGWRASDVMQGPVGPIPAC
jgi:hypothetical protein